MHTTETKNVCFIHNGDYSGEIIISGKDQEGKISQVVVWMDDLSGFLTGILRQKLISTLENADSAEVMRLAVQLGVTFPRRK